MVQPPELAGQGHKGLEINLAMHIEVILAAIQDTKAALELKIDTVAIDLGADHKKLVERVTDTELAMT